MGMDEIFPVSDQEMEYLRKSKPKKKKREFRIALRLPKSVHIRLRKISKKNRRSVNSEIVFAIESVLKMEEV